MKRRILSLFLTLTLLTSLMVPSVFAANNALSANKSVVAVGETITVSFAQPKTQSISAYDLNVGFDKTAFEAISVDRMTSVTDIAPDISAINNKASINLGYASANGTVDKQLEAGNLFSVTFKALKSGKYAFNITQYLVGGDYDENTYSATDITPSDAEIGSKTLDITVVSAISGDLPISITAPEKGNTPQSTIADGTGYTGSISWEPTVASGTFVANTTYTANVKLTAKDGYQFANDVTPTVTDAPISDKSVTDDGSKLTFKATFPKTADKVLTGIAISGGNSANVPTKNGTTIVNLTATASYDDSSSSAVTDSAAWSVVSTPAGVSVDKGVVTILPSAAAGNVSINATYNGKESSHSINLSKDAAKLATLNINGDDSVSVPGEHTYSVSGEDQYGASFSPTDVSWSIEGTVPTGVSIGANDGKLKIENAASAGSVTIKATSGAVSATKDITITKAASVPTTVNISGGVDSLTVPALVTFPGTSSMEATAFTVEVKDQYGEVMDGQTVQWSMTGNTGVTISDNGVLTITNAATTDSVTVTATCDSKVTTKTVTVTKATPAATFVQVKKGGTVVTSDSITIPTSGNTSVAYTAEVYDQYGAKIDNESVDWSISTMTGVSVSDGTVTVERTASEGSVTLTSATSSDSTKKAEVSITLSNKPIHNIGVFADASKTITYGDSITGQTVSSNTGTVQYSSSDSSAVSVDKNTGALAVHKASTTPVTITATVEETADYAVATASYTVAVNKKELTITGLTATERSYEPNCTTVTLTGGTLNGVVNAGEVSVTMPTSGTITSADAGNGKAVTVTKPELTGSNKYSYTLADITGVTVNISKADPAVGTVSYSGGTIYPSTDPNSITLSKTGAAAGELKLTDGQTLTVGTKDYNWTFTSSDTDNYNVLTGTVSLTVSEDTLVALSITGTPEKLSYKYGEAFETTGLTVTATYASGKTQDVTAQVTFGTLSVGQTEIVLKYQDVSCTVSDLTVDKADAKTLAEIAVSQKYSVVTEQSKQLGGMMPADAGTLTYTAGTPTVSGAATVSSFTVDNSGLVKYTITGSESGAVIALPVTIGSDNYADSTVNVVITLTDKEIPTAQANNINVTYTGADVPASAITGTASVDGTWNWKSAAPKTVANSGSYTVVFTPSDTITYATVEAAITVTISKATPIGAPTYTAITASGKKLLDANLAVGSITPAGGTIKWVNADNTDLANTAEVAANTNYKWLYSPVDTDNYNTLTGTIELWYRASSGGGGGGGSAAATDSVSAGKAENGSVSVSPKSASKGDTVTVTVTPDKGYALDKITVTDKNGKTVAVTKKSDTQYTFVMPNGKVEVKATFMEDNTMLNSFVDVHANDYYYDAVLWAAQKRVTAGTDATHFSPNASCTRAQIVTFLWRAVGSPEPKGTSSFTDVSTDSYYAKAVAWAVENGITGGTGNGKFSPDGTCTREQAVTFLYRAAGSPDVSGGSAFSDVAANAYYANAVAWAEQNKITGGIGGGLFGSGNDCTRGQIVTFLYRTMQEK